MDALSYKTISIKPEEVQKEWFVVDAAGQVAGRLATKVAMVLRGKTKTSYTPNIDCGDNVIIINAEKVRFTGRKMQDKQYVRYTGYPGGQRFETPRALLARIPERVLEHAIKGMLPKNKLGRKIYGNLYVYAGSEHPHQAQQPKELKID